MTDDQGQNWVALGGNMLDVSVDLLTLDLEGAQRKFFAEDNYQHEEEDNTIERLEARYDEYVELASDVDRIERELEKARALKAEICDNYTPKVGEHYDPRAPANLILLTTKTDQLHFNRFEELKPFYRKLGGSPNMDECAAADCLHPCYGASHEMNCSLCYNATF